MIVTFPLHSRSIHKNFKVSSVQNSKIRFLKTVVIAPIGSLVSACPTAVSPPSASHFARPMMMMARVASEPRQPWTCSPG